MFIGYRSYQGDHTSTQRGSRSLSEWKVSLGRGLRAGEDMKVGDLVQEKYITERIGVVIKVAGVRCYVRFADGGTLWGNDYHFWRLE